MIFALVPACEDATGPSEPPITPAPSARLVELKWEHPTPQGNDLHRMWGFPDGTFYAVGEAGTVLLHSGGLWTSVETGVREDLHGIWASGPGDVYVAGFDGTLIHFDGASWKKVSTPTQSNLYAVWVNAPDDLFITGMGGSVWNRFNGKWTEYAVAPGNRMWALVGYSHDEMYVSGSDASLLRFDGTSWNKVTIPLNLRGDHEYRDMWGPGPGMVSLLVGPSTVWTDGVTWSFLSGTGAAYGLWGLSLDNQVMVTAGGSRHLVDGVEKLFPTPTTEPLYDVWGTANNDYFAVGRLGHIAHFNGAGWEALDRGDRHDIRGLSVTGTNAVAVGADGLILRRNGTEWTSENVADLYDLWSVWEGDGLAVAVGRYAPDGRDWRQAILTNNTGSWVDAGAVGVAHRLFDVWGSSADNVCAVGWGGEIVRFDGLAWDVMVPCSGDAAFLRAIDGTAADHVIAVGRTNDLRGLVCRFDGANWTPTVLPDVEELWGVWVESPSSAVAVGSFGAIRRFDGSGWKSMNSPTEEQLFCVWGSSSSDVYAAGWEGTLVHFDGSRWQKLLPATNRTIHTIAGRSAAEVFFAGDAGAIWSFGGL